MNKQLFWIIFSITAGITSFAMIWILLFNLFPPLMINFCNATGMPLNFIGWENVLIRWLLLVFICFVISLIIATLKGKGE